MFPTAVSSEPATSSPPPRNVHWGRWVLAVLLLLGLAVGLALQQLDPWLRRKLEQQVTTASHGRYQLRIGHLHTSLRSRSLTLGHVWLRTTTSSTPDSARLPRVRLAVGRVEVAGVGLLALLRRGVVPIDRIAIDSVALQLASLPKTKQGSKLHEQLPVAGVRVGQFWLRQVRGAYGPGPQPMVQLGQGQLSAQDIWISAAGAADSQRVGYAAAVAGQVRGLAVQVPGHKVKLVRGAFTSAQQLLTLDSVVVHPTQPINNQRGKTARISLVLPRLQLTGVRAAQLTRQHFRADILRITAPRLALTVPTVKPPSLHVLLAPYLRECRLKHLEVVGGALRVAGIEQAPVAANVRAWATNIQVLPRQTTRTAIYYAQAWSVRTGRATLNLDAPYYNLSWQQLQADTRPGTLRLTGLRVVPTLSVVALARSKGHQAAHLKLQIPELRMAGVDYRAAQYNRVVQVTSITVPSAQLYTNSDGRFPINPSISVVTPEALGQVPFQFDVRVVRFQHGTIQMTYRAPRDPVPGTLSINRLAITLRNVSNNPKRMGPGSPLVGSASGWLSNRCYATLALRANLLDRSGAHTLQGTFQQTPLAILNPMIVPTRGIAIKSGTVEQIRFAMQLNRAAVRGTMWARYSDLKLQLLNQQERPGFLKRIETSLVNGIFLRDNNPRKPGQPVKPGPIVSARERRFSVFSLWRQGLVSGMLTSAGVPLPLAKKLSESQ
ncbi:DUF748 domain-containing protein [Hymenobacter fodinae]|uniref:DUF748 domain-containing protein n=1 Tax=Hymenobacter fodinae TaxID=2510796 RepID=A0A4Z0P4S4_9BACT|nr:DUF748 domain-containing protein [Hymenobacter fodinae]TGE06562.1 DUF748 domain-containing protein [Hymenobacter fodinae]